MLSKSWDQRQPSYDFIVIGSGLPAGTGLLVACALDPKRIKACGAGSIEEYLRTKGIGVIHGGANALRFTPHFNVTSEELHLIVDAIREAQPELAIASMAGVAFQEDP